METKDDQRVIPDDEEFLSLLQKARDNDPDATLKLIELFKGDIVHISKYIHMSEEDAVSDIILEFLEMIKRREEK
ncbi:MULTISPECIES: hypothetical protein [Paenibacillus]|jgi:hypothetical protein|uniref:Helix-turn-helix conjugative transposon-like domain-containing protein n=2 Tax=Paenibacillus barengoltzii TaxID=343517 RepID=R9LAG6_9BACL|nr:MULTISPECIES: hypothetical protein [Paenibacillus]EOS55710.1 hypothetical protein C812_02842 [Paenibacillus barengoltzii G22]MEC2343619.1 hypothetical protein [Paenibacillus barengoltzii]SME98656.1 hypothetical protein SAMN02744102_00732 [Paenibacillus barengoltzii]SMF35003.1 hypothetical protein SAMN02744124_02565 [Paenibacillus barengoltzii J12]